jgi:FKBP-type peptidyl-prolyl cis-trans isomerase (trigger factor)
MKIGVKVLDNGKKEISIEVAGDLVKEKFEEVFKKIGQQAKVPGFRVGHVPRDILEKNFSTQAHEQVLKELIPDIYHKAIEKEALEVVDLPEISDVKLDRATLLFKATVEVSPQIKLREYKGLKVNYKKIEVSADEVKRALDSLKEAHKVDTMDDAFARALGYPRLAELQQAMEKQIFLQKENTQRQKIEGEIIGQLTKDLEFRLPAALVKRQLEDMVRQAKLDLALKGLSRERIDEQEKTLTQELEPRAKEQVRVYLVLAEIAKRENIPQDEQMPRKVMELLLKDADWKEAA